MRPTADRLRAWLRPPRRAAHAATHRNVYILPSGAGWLFALLLTVLLVASINDRLALGYALTFGLASVALASMPMTHEQVRGLRLRLAPIDPVPAGTPATLALEIDHPGPARQGLRLRLSAQTLDLDLPADATTTIRGSLPTSQRGWQALPPVVVESRFPFGLFRAWTVWRPEPAVLVWPAAEQPAPPLPAPAGAPADTDPSSAGTAPVPAFDGLRPWRAGDGPRDIAWKHLARRPAPLEPISRDLVPLVETSPLPPLWLTWDDAAGASATADQTISRDAARQRSDTTRIPDARGRTVEGEARLSRLAAWVQAAHQAGRPCGLRLPGCHIGPSLGEAHRRQLLQALALWS
jgi:uncharacterized protein (DUF58 family)